MLRVNNSVCGRLLLASLTTRGYENFQAVCVIAPTVVVANVANVEKS